MIHWHSQAIKMIQQLAQSPYTLLPFNKTPLYYENLGIQEMLSAALNLAGI